MGWTCRVLAAAVLWMALGASSGAQAPAKNPHEGDPDAIRNGAGLYRARCADCHGMDARGVRAPDLTRVWATGRTDQGLFDTIRRGVSGTEMPSFVPPRNTDVELWQILAYLRTLAPNAAPDPPRGNAQNGERVFQAMCSSCHRVNGVGGVIGPDLSRIGGARTPERLVVQIRRGFEESPFGYQPVTLTPPEGPAIHGVKKNEDLFSVQIMDTSERIQGYEKDKMKSVVNTRRSLMPAYGPARLSERDLDDLVRYLMTLRGFNPAVPQ
ncbi:MAG: c-type cytochrome [Acidobacteriota bacterium]